jgi:uncharacterized protein
MPNQKSAILKEAEAWVRGRLEASDHRAHGWPHTRRVRGNIQILAQPEGVDPFLAELSALLHDVGRTLPGPENEHGARSAILVEPFLAELPLTDGEREAVLHAVRWHNSGRADAPLLCILRDADMLDGLGAIGIIRAFMSRSHLAPYEPDAPFVRGRAQWPARYSTDQLFGQMDWFDRLNTDTAREMARERLSFMEAFVEQARREISTEDH